MDRKRDCVLRDYAVSFYYIINYFDKVFHKISLQQHAILPFSMHITTKCGSGFSLYYTIIILTA